METRVGLLFKDDEGKIAFVSSNVEREILTEFNTTWDLAVECLIQAGWEIVGTTNKHTLVLFILN